MANPSVVTTLAPNILLKVDWTKLEGGAKEQGDQIKYLVQQLQDMYGKISQAVNLLSKYGPTLAEQDGSVLFGAGGIWTANNAPTLSAANMTNFPVLSTAHTALSSDVTMTNSNQYYDGPS